MRLLILGGTSFVGRHAVEAALDRGHEVTIFNRGRTNAGLFEGRVDERRGDRATGDYASLADGRWDGVIDVNAYFKRQVTQAVAAVGGRAGHYTFVSTVSVYSEPGKLAEIDDRDSEQVTGETYGALKVVCEDEVRAAFGENSTMVRPGIVAGPHDPTDRFTHWVRVGAAGGEVAVSRPDQPVQVVHGRDLGDFLVHVTEQGTTGAYDAVGEQLELGDLVQRVASVAGSTVTVEPGEAESDAPLTLPPDGSHDWLFRIDPAPATAAGLRNRPIAETIADTLTWDQGRR
jgi:2'-hydroxyisoflavone reductase